MPPKVVDGLMTGMGAVIVAHQFNWLVLEGAKDSALSHGMATLLIFVTVWVSIQHWSKIARFTFLDRVPFLRKLPSTAWALLLAAGGGQLLGELLSYPQMNSDTLTLMPNGFAASSFSKIDLNILTLALSIALLSASKAMIVSLSLHKQDRQPYVDFNRELIVLGFGNVLTGGLAGLPVTAQSERSQFSKLCGAETRLATVLQGLWVPTAIVLLASMIAIIPTAAFAALIAYSGWKLVDLRTLKFSLSQIRKSKFVIDRNDSFIFLGTVASTLVFNLSTGVIVGLIFGMIKLASTFASSAEIHIHQVDGELKLFRLKLQGAFSFMSIPTLVSSTKDLPIGSSVFLDTRDVYYIDHACLTFLEELQDNVRMNGGSMDLDFEDLLQKSEKPLNGRIEVLSHLKNLDRRGQEGIYRVGRRAVDRFIDGELSTHQVTKVETVSEMLLKEEVKS